MVEYVIWCVSYDNKFRRPFHSRCLSDSWNQNTGSGSLEEERGPRTSLKYYLSMNSKYNSLIHFATFNHTLQHRTSQLSHALSHHHFILRLTCCSTHTHTKTKWSGIPTQICRVPLFPCISPICHAPQSTNLGGPIHCIASSPIHLKPIQLCIH